MIPIKNKRVTVIGAAKSGQSAAKLIVHHGGKVKISESGPEKLPAEFKSWAEQHRIAMEWNGHHQDFIEASDVVVLSPGVLFNAPPAQWARAKGIPVIGEIELAYQFCDRPIIAVTGSNGKTTVSTLIHQVIKEAGYGVCLCGNVGMPFSEFVLQSDQKDFFVLEISSFQLESLLEPQSIFRSATGHGQMHFKGFKPHIAVILNFSQNHLDRHKDLQEYFEAKFQVLRYQTKDQVSLIPCELFTDKATSTMMHHGLKNLASHLCLVSMYEPDQSLLESIERNDFSANTFECMYLVYSS